MERQVDTEGKQSVSYFRSIVRNMKTRPVSGMRRTLEQPCQVPTNSQLERIPPSRRMASDEALSTNLSHNVINSLKVKPKCNSEEDLTKSGLCLLHNTKKKENDKLVTTEKKNGSSQLVRSRIQDEATRSTLFDRRTPRNEIKFYDYRRRALINYSLNEKDTKKRPNFHGIIKSLAERRQQEESLSLNIGILKQTVESKQMNIKKKPEELGGKTDNQEESSDVFVFEELEGEKIKSNLCDSFMWIRKQ